MNNTTLDAHTVHEIYKGVVDEDEKHVEDDGYIEEEELDKYKRYRIRGS